MEDLSLHILDIVENSVAAEADKIEIRIIEDKKKDLLSVEVLDNGAGMDNETVKKVLDPFYTSKTVRRFGLGLPLLSEAAKAANGQLSIKSKKGEGTKVKADFQHSHIDRKPLGDIGQTIVTLVLGSPEIDLIYVHIKNDHKYSFDTRKLKTQLMGVPINSPAGIRMIKEDLKKGRK
ncbi:MAG: sensor histidine kinase [Candidatus Aminicenantes bacterium]|nr:MAG: sensor histidine kinase [Candidatus Aminicenantes bacterium]